MFNKVILIGRLTKDPEARVTNNGTPVTTFTLAVNRAFQTAQGDREADFINCVSFNKLAENIGKYMRKGSLMNVEGRIQTRSYDGQDGVKRYVTEVICDNVVFLETRSQQNTSSYQQQSSYQQSQPYQQQPSFNINEQQQQNHNMFSNQQQDNVKKDYFNEDHSNIDISEDDLPF